MKGFLITHKGMEDIAALEVKELIGESSKLNDTIVVFNIKSFDALFKLCYTSQSASRIGLLLKVYKTISSIEDIRKGLDKIDFNEWLGKDITFRVKCSKHLFEQKTTPELEKIIGNFIITHIEKNYHYKPKVNLENPQIVIHAHIAEKKCYLGLEFSDFDLSKRTYKIFTNPSDIKGTIAYSLIRLAGFKSNNILLDPISGSGTIAIEAALFASKIPVNFFNKDKFLFLGFDKFKKFYFKEFFKKIDKKISKDKLDINNLDPSMKYINYAKKNSKIADVDKIIRFSRADLEWLDTKFDKNKVDKIITQMPSMQNSDCDIKYNEFFYQAEFILNKKGKIVIIGNKEKVEKYSSRHNFIISKTRIVYSGKKQNEVFVIEKKNFNK